MNAEMYYHAQALERISELAHKVYNLDSTKEADVNFPWFLPPLNIARKSSKNSSPLYLLRHKSKVNPKSKDNNNPNIDHLSVKPKVKLNLNHHL